MESAEQEFRAAQLNAVVVFVALVLSHWLSSQISAGFLGKAALEMALGRGRDARDRPGASEPEQLFPGSRKYFWQAALWTTSSLISLAVYFWLYLRFRFAAVAYIPVSMHAVVGWVTKSGIFFFIPRSWTQSAMFSAQIIQVPESVYPLSIVPWIIVCNRVISRAKQIISS